MLIWILGAALAWACSVPAWAQKDPSPLNRVEVGWGGAVPVGRWVPIRVWLDGSAAGAATEGLLIVEYQQDRTQMAQVRVPVSTTPGKLTPVELVASIPLDTPSVEVTYEEGGRRHEVSMLAPPTAGAATTSPNPGVRQLGPFYAGARGLLLHVGVGSIDRAFPKPGMIDRSPTANGNMVTDMSLWRGQNLETLRWMQLAAADTRMEDLFSIPRAYDGVEALILDAPKAAGLDPRVKAAIVRWVEAGGRLVLITTDDSPTWRSWLPIGEAGDLIEAGPPGRFAVPTEAKGALTAREVVVDVIGAAPRDPAQPWGWQSGSTLFKETAAAPVPIRAEVVARSFLVTERGRRDGWTTDWEAGAGRGLIARGPVGMGIVTIVGVDPETIPDGLDAAASGKLWRSALRPALAHYLATPLQNGAPGSIDVTSSLNSIISVPELDNSVFNTILVSLGLLAVVLGPIDWFVLKRWRARQHSWLVALVWIGAASLAAYFIPPMLRSGPPQLNRLVTADVVQSRGDGTGSVRAWQHGLLGIFASGPLRIRPDDGLKPGGSGDGVLAGTWWRGTSPADENFGNPFMGGQRRRINIFAPVVTPQVTSADRERQNVPMEFSMPSWSYRTFEDSAEPGDVGAMPIRVRVTRDGEVVKVSLSGTPAEVVSATVRTSREASAVAGSPGRVEVTLPEGTRLAPERAVAHRGAGFFEWDASGRYGEAKPRETGTTGSHWALGLESPSRRTAAIDARVASGAWALVEVVMPTALPTSGFMAREESERMGFEETHLSVVRILCPIDPPLPPAEKASGEPVKTKEPGP
jgi:hypothetical protein